MYWGNNSVLVSHYFIKSSRLPSEFNGYKIVQISDLHNKVFPKNNTNLIKSIKYEKPDSIFITGELIDRRRYDEEKALMLIKELKSIAPIYYVPGNHEAWSGKFSYLEDKLLKEY
nr:metallophosphoesterase [Clostridium cochlearium]